MKNFPIDYLTTNHRLPPMIFNHIERSFYKEADLMSADFKILSSGQKLSRERAIKLYPKIPLLHNQVLLDIIGSHDKQNLTTRSWSNPQFVAIALQQAERLRNAGYATEDLAILTFYQGQVHQYELAMQQLRRRRQNPQEPLDVRTVDGYQGQERKVVILDFVRTGRPGFLVDPHRLNVALSRCQDGCVLIMDVRSHVQVRQRNMQWIEGLIGGCHRQRCVQKVNVRDGAVASV